MGWLDPAWPARSALASALEGIVASHLISFHLADKAVIPGAMADRGRCIGSACRVCWLSAVAELDDLKGLAGCWLCWLLEGRGKGETSALRCRVCWVRGCHLQLLLHLLAFFFLLLLFLRLSADSGELSLGDSHHIQPASGPARSTRREWRVCVVVSSSGMVWRWTGDELFVCLSQLGRADLNQGPASTHLVGTLATPLRAPDEYRTPSRVRRQASCGGAFFPAAHVSATPICSRMQLTAYIVDVNAPTPSRSCFVGHLAINTSPPGFSGAYSWSAVQRGGIEPLSKANEGYPSTHRAQCIFGLGEADGPQAGRPSLPRSHTAGPVSQSGAWDRPRVPKA